MTFGDILWNGVLLQSIGVVGLLFARKHTAQQAQPADTLTEESPRERIRAGNRLRPIAAHEEGSAIGRLPVGVYGFTYSPLTETPLFADHRFHSFEVHKLGNGKAHLVACVTPAEAAAIREGRASEVRLYPDRWEQATEFVSIPFDRIASKKMLPSRQAGNCIHCTVHSPE